MCIYFYLLFLNFFGGSVGGGVLIQNFGNTIKANILNWSSYKFVEVEVLSTIYTIYLNALENTVANKTLLKQVKNIFAKNIKKNTYSLVFKRYSQCGCVCVLNKGNLINCSAKLFSKLWIGSGDLLRGAIRNNFTK